MSNIEDLIQQLCPNGVEFKELGKCTLIKRGRRVTKNELSPEKKYPVYSGGVTPMGYFEKYNQSANTITIVKYGTAGFVNYIIEDFWANDVCYCIEPTHGVEKKYLFYFLKSRQEMIQSLSTNAIPAHLPTDAIEKIKIPIPPLPIQQEIANILDKFTQLEAELEAELEARRAQYEYYRNDLLNFEGKEVEWKTLGEIGKFIRGNGLQKKDFTESGIGCIHYGQIYTYYGTFTDKTKSYVSVDMAKKFKKAQKGDLIIATTSENVEDVCKTVVWLGNEEICISGETYIFKHNQNSKYLAYYLQTPMFFDYKKQNVTGTKVIRLHGDKLEKFSIPIPPLTEQERIVGILDKFDALVNDISTGLPAEIEARRKQYEYYRGKLLSFEPLTTFTTQSNNN